MYRVGKSVQNGITSLIPGSPGLDCCAGLQGVPSRTGNKGDRGTSVHLYEVLNLLENT